MTTTWERGRPARTRPAQLRLSLPLRCHEMTTTWERGRPARTSPAQLRLSLPLRCHEMTTTWERGRPARTRPAQLHRSLPLRCHEMTTTWERGRPARTRPAQLRLSLPLRCHEMTTTWERGRPARTSLGTATLISSHQSTGNGVAKELSTKLHEERPRATKGFGAAFPSHPAWRGKGDVMRGFPRERGRPARTSLGTASPIAPTSIKRIVQMMFPVCTGPTMLK